MKTEREKTTTKQPDFFQHEIVRISVSFMGWGFKNYLQISVRFIHTLEAEEEKKLDKIYTRNEKPTKPKWSTKF